MPDVLSERTGSGVAVLTLNRPDSLNAMGGDLMALLAQHLSECAADRTVRCVVLTGAGRGFCSGGDVKSMAARGAAPGRGDGPAAAALAERVKALRQLQRATSHVLHTMAKPTVAMVNGAAAGAGLSLALACDLRVASDRAKLGVVFPKVGFSGDFGGSYFLSRLVGAGKARELYFTGEMLSAEEALRMGMVNRVVPHEQLKEETMRLAEQLAAGPTLAYGRMKENLDLAEHDDLAAVLDLEALNMVLSSLTRDHREAAQAFVEKRTPDFLGE